MNPNANKTRKRWVSFDALLKGLKCRGCATIDTSFRETTIIIKMMALLRNPEQCFLTGLLMITIGTVVLSQTQGAGLCRTH